MKHFSLWLMVTLSLLFPCSCFPGTVFPKPTKSVILTVFGAIDVTNQGEQMVFDLPMLKTLPHYQISTHTPWEEGLHKYRGFRPKDMLDALGAKGSVLRLSALNDYITEIPIDDFKSNDAIIAFEMDDRTMPVRHKGPLMVIYNFDANKKFRSETYYGRSIWQIKTIEVLHSGG